NNHEIAPETSDASGLYEGRAPLMPAAHTKHPQGRAPFDPATLRAVWFEEGDGVALLDEEGLLAVIPGWAEADRGLPGYSRDAIGRSAYAWALDDVGTQLLRRVDNVVPKRSVRIVLGGIIVGQCCRAQI